MHSKHVLERLLATAFLGCLLGRRHLLRHGLRLDPGELDLGPGLAIAATCDEAACQQRPRCDASLEDARQRTLSERETLDGKGAKVAALRPDLLDDLCDVWEEGTKCGVSVW